MFIGVWFHNFTAKFSVTIHLCYIFTPGCYQESEVDTFLSSLPNAFLSPAGSVHSRSILQDGGYSRIVVSKGS